MSNITIDLDTDKLKAVEEALWKLWGPLTLFALFQREGFPNTWDLVIGTERAPRKGKIKAIELVMRKLEENGIDLTAIAKIIILGSSEPVVQAVNRAITTEHEPVAVSDAVFFGLSVKRAIIITSRKGAAKRKNAAKRKRTVQKKRS
jgi:hypothetical protein